MASPAILLANDENATTVKAPTQMLAPATTNRRVLGDVSPNVKLAAPTIGALKTKPMTSSPLKRSFTAMAEEGAGFTYLKKRRVSLEQPSAGRGGVVEQRRVSASPVEDSMRFRPDQAADSSEADLPTVPTIQEQSPTEPNTPSDNSIDDNQGSSVDRKSFSSLINYDPSSQQTRSNLVFKHPSKAELLRLRLRVAMYKVRTNQVDVPFDQLHVQGEAGGHKPKSTSEAVEEAVAQLRREAQEEMSSVDLKGRAYPKLLPAPVLRPTAYSSRMIYDQALPFAPPTSRSPQRPQQVRQLATPAQAEGGQLSSPPDSAERRIARRVEEMDVVGSVVKGHVAEGLLGLRNAV